jgi:hypothetical protein
MTTTGTRVISSTWLVTELSMVRVKRALARRTHDDLVATELQRLFGDDVRRRADLGVEDV